MLLHINGLCLFSFLHYKRLLQGSLEPLEIEELLSCSALCNRRWATTSGVSLEYFLQILIASSLLTPYLLTRHQHRTQIIVRAHTLLKSTLQCKLFVIVCFHLQSCWRDDAQRLRSSVHRRNSHAAVTQPWQIPTNHRIHVHPNVHRCETLNQLVCIYIHFHAHSHCCACILKILMTMTRNLFCYSPCDVSVTVVLYAQKLSLKMRWLAWVGTTHIKVGEEKMEPTVTQEWMDHQIRWRRKPL